MNPLARRFVLGSLLAGGLLVAAYLRSIEALVVEPSGRTLPGLAFGLLATLAMAGAALYSWRRRFIARASRAIAVDPEKRKELIARERRALAALETLERELLRQPDSSPRRIEREARKILRTNRVGRTIRARVERGAGRAARLVTERREWSGRLETWYYWHLSLGALAIPLVLLHSGFRFGNVIAAAAFVCLVGVVVTGIVGVYLYRTVPPMLTEIEERAERTPEELREELREVNRELAASLEGKSEVFRRVCAQEIAIPGVSLEPGLGWLFGRAAIEYDTARPDRLRLVVKEVPSAEQEDFRKAIRLIFLKEKLEVSLYPQLRYDYLMKVWLSAHIPLSAGLWAFAAIHIVSVAYF